MRGACSHNRKIAVSSLKDGILRAQVLILVVEGVEADGEIHAARRKHVVNAEVNLTTQMNVRDMIRCGSKSFQYHSCLGMSHALDEARVLLRRRQRVVLALGACDKRE